MASMTLPLFANHPLLVDFMWKTPLIFLSRARRPEEIQGNVLGDLAGHGEVAAG